MNGADLYIRLLGAAAGQRLVNEEGLTGGLAGKQAGQAGGQDRAPGSAHLAAEAPRAPDAVNVQLTVVGQVVVDDQRHLRYRRYVGRFFEVSACSRSFPPPP